MKIIIVSVILLFAICPSYGQFSSVEELTKHFPSQTVKQIHSDLVALALDVKTDKPINVKFTVLEFTDGSYSVFFVAKKVENKWIEVKSSFVPIQQGVNRLKAVLQDRYGENIVRGHLEQVALENSLRKHNPFTSLEEKGYQYVSVESQTDIIAVKDLRFENGKIETDLVKPYEKPEKNYAFWQTFQISDSIIWEWFKTGGLVVLAVVLVKLLKKISQM